MAKSPKYAFRCRNCGHLEEAGQAGERRVPAACRYCGRGVKFDGTTGIKVHDEDNRIVLADLPDKELAPILKFFAIEKADIARHKPWKPVDPDRTPQTIDRSTEGHAVGAEDHAG